MLAAPAACFRYCKISHEFISHSKHPPSRAVPLDPTPVQYDIAYNLQHGDKRMIIQAFRGVGKSWITSAYVVWLLYMNPQLNILVVSASKSRSDDFTTFTLRLINEMELLAHLRELLNRKRLHLGGQPCQFSRPKKIKLHCREEPPPLDKVALLV
jgi:hypothetical protein